MAQHIFKGTAAPTITPLAVGHHFIDTVNKVTYISVGTVSSADWQASSAGSVAAALAAHEADVANPHSVTKTQVGLGNVDNTSDVNKPVSTAQATAIAAVQSDIDAHEANTANPHSVTKTQIGLGNADNTSDANKPISTAQQTALNLKAPLANPAFTGAPTAPTQTAGDNSDKIATTAYVDSSIPTVADATPTTKGIVKLAGDLSGTADSPTVPALATKASASALATHVGDTANPHSVTKTQIGLGNVDNTADANKPVSTAQGLADVAVYDAAVQRSNHTGTQPLSTLSQSGATTGQRPQWNGTTWVPVSPSGVAAWGDIVGTLSDQTDLQDALNLKADLTALTGNNNSWAGFDASGNLFTVPNWSRNSFNGLDRSNGIDHNDNNDYKSLNRNNLAINALQDSPNDVAELHNHFFEVDNQSTGFTMGTNNGSAFVAHSTYMKHVGISDTGGLTAFTTNFEIGNGTDPIDVRGFAYHYGFGSVRSGVTLSGGIQGYGFQPHIDAGVNINQYTQAFYDGATFESPVAGYTSFSAGPQLAEIKNGSNYTGINCNPTIPSFEGNASTTLIGLYGQYGTFDTGNFTGIRISPTIDEVGYAVGLDISMNNVTTTVGSPATVTIQDFAITTSANGSGGNGFTFELVDDATAGSEYVSGSVPAFQIHIQSGVSTATQVKAALDAFGGLAGNIATTITGVGSNPQLAQSPSALAGGTNDGTKKAARFEGDVEITGALSFGGALSIAKLNAFATQALADGGGSPASIHGLITQPTVGDNQTIANVDTLGVNTAMLLSIGNDSHLTSGFLGVTALGLPAVVSMGNNSTIDRVAGATFAISMSGGGTGASIDTVDLCRALAIPDGVTAINKLVGYKMDLPFGDPGTQTWGVYITPAVANYFAGSVKVGTGADTPTSGFTFDVNGAFRTESSLGEMIRATNSGLSFFGNSPVVQQTSAGPQTAGAVYTGTEQTMIQQMYDALRLYGLLT